MVLGPGIYVDEYNYGDSLQVHTIERMDLSGSNVAILNSAVSMAVMGCSFIFLLRIILIPYAFVWLVFTDFMVPDACVIKFCRGFLTSV